MSFILLAEPVVALLWVSNRIIYNHLHHATLVCFIKTTSRVVWVAVNFYAMVFKEGGVYIHELKCPDIGEGKRRVTF